MELWWRTFQTVDRVEIVHVDLSANLGREACALNWLDSDELHRFHRYQTNEGRRQFALCRSALRASLVNTLGCNNEDLRFSDSRQSKPVATVSGKLIQHEFNVSHSHRHALIALSAKGKVGIDVEERVVRHDMDGEIAEVFSPLERETLSNTSGENKVQMFFRLWTIKESLIKAIGKGFRLDTSTFTIPEQLIHGARRANFRFPCSPAQEWQIENLENEQFAAALAHETE